jgi:hypothetical protein
MKKYLPLLEKNVQWVAIAIGVGFLLYMVYANVIAPPMHVNVNGEQLTPARVETYITEQAVNELEQKVKEDPRRVPPELNTKPKFVDVFPPVQQVPAIASSAFPNLAVAIEDKTIKEQNPNNPQNQGQPNVAGQVVAALPAAPAPINLRIEARRASVNLAPPANPNNPAAAPPQQLADIDYVSVAFDIPIKDIAGEFRKTKIPAALTTSFLEVQLIRQEKDDQGNWGGEKVVEKLKNSDQPAAPDPKNRNAIQGYIAWAEQNQPSVLQPKFYEIVKGDQWVLPGTQPVNVNTSTGQWAPRPANEGDIRPGFDPAIPPPDMTRAEKQAKYKFDVEKRRREQAEKNRNKPQPTPGGGRGGMPGGPGGGRGGMPGGGGMEGGFDNTAPAPGSLGIVTFQVGAAGEGYPGGRPPMPGMPGMPGAYPGEFDPGMMPQQGGVQQGPVPCPTSSFDPRVLTIDPVTGWGHDDTVRPGKTYRYKVRYTVKNPVYGAKGIANPPALADGFNIASADSAWTDEVSIGERAYYYVVRTIVSNGSAEFEVYTFGQGKWNVSKFIAFAGDAIGGKKDEVDYSTGYTVVDVRSERNDQVVVLADAEGNLKRRSLRTDSSDQQRDKLKQQIAAATAPPPGTETGYPGGAPGMPGYPPGAMPGGEIPGMPGMPAPR